MSANSIVPYGSGSSYGHVSAFHPPEKFSKCDKLVQDIEYLSGNLETRYLQVASSPSNPFIVQIARGQLTKTIEDFERLKLDLMLEKEVVSADFSEVKALEGSLSKAKSSLNTVAFIFENTLLQKAYSELDTILQVAPRNKEKYCHRSGSISHKHTLRYLIILGRIIELGKISDEETKSIIRADVPTIQKQIAAIRDQLLVHLIINPFHDRSGTEAYKMVEDSVYRGLKDLEEQERKLLTQIVILENQNSAWINLDCFPTANDRVEYFDKLMHLIREKTLDNDFALAFASDLSRNVEGLEFPSFSNVRLLRRTLSDVHPRDKLEKAELAFQELQLPAKEWRSLTAECERVTQQLRKLVNELKDFQDGNYISVIVPPKEINAAADECDTLVDSIQALEKVSQELAKI